MAARLDHTQYADVAIPPGEYLLEEMEARGLTQKALAGKMGRPYQAVNEIVNGKKAITAQTAWQLHSAMPEIPPSFWMNLESHYQLTKARIRMDRERSQAAG